MANAIIKLRGFNELRSTLANAPRRVKDLGRVWLLSVAEAEKIVIQAEAPVRSGRFRRTIVPYARDMVAGVKLEPYPRLGLKLANWIIQGTRAHIIEPRHARALHFVSGGQDVFAARVRHPGTKPNDFLTRGSRKFDPRVRGTEQNLKRQIVAELKAQIKRR